MGEVKPVKPAEMGDHTPQRLVSLPQEDPNWVNPFSTSPDEVDFPPISDPPPVMGQMMGKSGLAREIPIRDPAESARKGGSTLLVVLGVALAALIATSAYLFFINPYRLLEVIEWLRGLVGA